MADADPPAGGKPRAKRAKPADTLDPIEIAMKAVAAGADRDSPARRVLDEHAELIVVQRQREREAWRVLRLQRVTRWLILGAVALILVGFAAMIGDAYRSRGTVIETFQVPPSLAAQGLTGEAVAGRIIDRLTGMRGRSESSRAVDTLESGWRNDYRVAIPQTGISIGEVRTALRRWLGDETVINGEVHRTTRGIAVTVRSNKAASATFEGAETEIDVLVERAAEDIYRKTSPYLYASFLTAAGRQQESLEVLHQLAASEVPPTERAWAFNGIAFRYINLGRCAEAIAAAERGLTLDPDIANLSGNLSDAHACLGHWQASADHLQRAHMLYSAGRGQNPRRAQRLSRITRAGVAAALHDYRLELALYEEVEASDGSSDMSLPRAQTLAAMKDVRGSLRALAQWRRSSVTPLARGGFWVVRYLQAAAVDDWTAATVAARRMGEAVQAADPYLYRTRSEVLPLLAVAAARSRDGATATAAVRDLPMDCLPCLWARAVVAESGGRHREADRWFGRASEFAPRLPMPSVEWANARLARGDPLGALRLFDQALRLASESADAHKGRADALGRLGRLREALRSYSSAAERAPRWGGLHINWGIALWQAGHRDDARLAWGAASRMDLSRGDRARLERILARTSSRG